MRIRTRNANVCRRPVAVATLVVAAILSGDSLAQHPEARAQSDGPAQPSAKANRNSPALSGASKVLEERDAWLKRASEHDAAEKPAEALEAAKKALTLVREMAGADADEALEPLLFIGRHQERQGKHSLAGEAFRDAWTLAKKRYGETDYRTIDIRQDWQQAERIVALTPERRERLAEYDDLDDLEASPSDPESLADAVKRYEEAVKLRREILGDSARDTLSGINRLSQLYFLSRQPRKAFTQIRLLSELRAETLGEDHPDTARTWKAIAELAVNSGDAVAAEKNYSRALAVIARVIGEETVETAQLVNSLAQLHEATRQFEKAEPLRRRYADLSEALKGADHYDSIDARVAHANTARKARFDADQKAIYAETEQLKSEMFRLNSQRKFRAAYDVLSRYLEKMQELLGEIDPDVADAHTAMANLSRGLREFSRGQAHALKALEIETKLRGEDHPSRAERLDNLASLYLSSGNYAKQVPLLRESLRIREKIYEERNLEIAESLNRLAFVKMNLRQHVDALPLLERVQAIKEALLDEDHPDLLMSLDSLAYCLDRAGRAEEAEKLYRRVLRSREKTPDGDPEDIARTTSQLADVLRRSRRFEEARELLDRLLFSARKRGDKPRVAQTLDALGDLARDEGNDQKAETHYRRSVEWRESQFGPNHSTTATGYENLGMCLTRQRKFEESEKALRHALEIRRSADGPDSSSTADVLEYLAEAMIGPGKSDEAERLMVEALAIREISGGDESHVVRSLNSLAELYDKQARNSKAEPIYRRAIEIAETALGPEHPTTAQTLLRLAESYLSTGRPATAEPVLRRALAISVVLPETEANLKSACLTSAAKILAWQNRFEEAEPLFRRALELSEKRNGNDHANTATTLSNHAMALKALGRTKEAGRSVRLALEISLRIHGEDHPATAASLEHVALQLADENQDADALTFYQRALAAREKSLGPNHPITAHSLDLLADCLERLERPKEAEPLLRRSVEIRERVQGRQHPDVALGLEGFAQFLESQGRMDEALDVARRSLDVQQRARLHLGRTGLERGSRVRFSAIVATWAAHAAQPTEAATRWEQSLGRGLWDDLSARQSRSVPVQDVRLERDLTRRLDRLDEEAAELEKGAGEPAQDPRRKELVAERARLQAELTALQERMSQEHGVHSGALYPLDRIQKAIPENAALVGWIDVVSERKAFVLRHWAVVIRSRGEPKFLSLNGTGKDGAWTKEDESLASNLRETLRGTKPGGDLNGLLARMKARRWTPLRAALGAEKDLPAVRQVIVLPSPDVAGIPVETFADDTLTVSYAPSGTVYAWLRELRTTTPVEHRKGPLLALGDPVFEELLPGMPSPEPKEGVVVTAVTPGSAAARAGLKVDDVLVSYDGAPLNAAQYSKVADTRKDDSEETPVTVWRRGNSFEVRLPSGPLGILVSAGPLEEKIAAQRSSALSDVRGEKLKPLPATRREIERLVALFQDSKQASRLLLGSDASEQVLAELAETDGLKNYRYLAFATHGEANASRPFDSRLYLARDRLPDPLQQLRSGRPAFRGVLTAETILKDWSLDAELVTLSACQTALGRESSGEGYLGFAQALLLSGARSLVLTLWSVDDEATGLLMPRFYENVLGARAGLKGPMSKAAALREAKRWLRGLTSDEAKTLLTRGKGEVLNPVKTVPATSPETAKKGVYAHPRFWAGFILIGDPE